jgi:hypothetical protein
VAAAGLDGAVTEVEPTAAATVRSILEEMARLGLVVEAVVGILAAPAARAS